ncbi:MAG: hypothetical protein WC972_03105 [Trueperaceae bacterium]
MNPLPVREVTERPPRDRPQNAPVRITPPALQAFAHRGQATAGGTRGVILSVWATLWWLSDAESAPTTGAFSTAFSSAFDGGTGSPQGSAFSTAFSSAFGQ